MTDPDQQFQVQQPEILEKRLQAVERRLESLEGAQGQQGQAQGTDAQIQQDPNAPQANQNTEYR